MNSDYIQKNVLRNKIPNLIGHDRFIVISISVVRLIFQVIDMYKQYIYYINIL